MSERPICKRCSKPILGIIKVCTSKKKSGSKSISKTDYYDEECFYALNREQALNEYQKERASKKKN